MVEITPAFHPRSTAFATTIENPDRLNFVADAIAFSQSHLPPPPSSSSNCSFSPSLASRPHSRSFDLTDLPIDTMTKQLQAKQVMLNELEASHAEQLALIGRLKAERRTWEEEEAKRRKERDEIKELNDMLMKQCTDQAKQLSLLSKKGGTGGLSMFLMRDTSPQPISASQHNAPPSPQFDKLQPASATGNVPALNGVNALPPPAHSSSSAAEQHSSNATVSSSSSTISTSSNSSSFANQSAQSVASPALTLTVPSSSPSSAPSTTITSALSPTSPSSFSSTLTMTVASLEQQLATAQETITKQKKELSLLRFLHPHTHQNEAKLSSISSLYQEEKDENDKLRKKLDELNSLNGDLEMALERQDGVIESLSVQQEESGRKERGWRTECDEWKAREGKVREELKCIVEGKEAVEMQLAMVERERDEDRKGRLGVSSEDREKEREREQETERMREEMRAMIERKKDEVMQLMAQREAERQEIIRDKEAVQRERDDERKRMEEQREEEREKQHREREEERKAVEQRMKDREDEWWLRVERIREEMDKLTRQYKDEMAEKEAEVERREQERLAVVEELQALKEELRERRDAGRRVRRREGAAASGSDREGDTVPAAEGTDRGSPLSRDEALGGRGEAKRRSAASSGRGREEARCRRRTNEA